MRRERRLIWCEDQYQLLGCDGGDRYYGRSKGETYQVFRKRGDSVRRTLVQTVDTDTDWFWDETLNLLVGESKEAESRQDQTSAAETYEHVLYGYQNSHRLENLKAGVLLKSIQLSNGAEATVYEPAFLREWVISIHGGPCSFETPAIRYGGLYRELLRRDIGVLVLNYRGSTGLEKPSSVSWKNSILEDFLALRNEIVMNDRIPVHLLGASFGGALALILADHDRKTTKQVKKTLLISPLLDLNHQRERGGDDFRIWFDSTFSTDDYRDFSFVALTSGLSAAEVSTTAIIHGSDDEVLGQEMFDCMKADRGVPRAGVLFFRHAGGHQPRRYRDAIFQTEQAFRFLTSP